MVSAVKLMYFFRVVFYWFSSRISTASKLLFQRLEVV